MKGRRLIANQPAFYYLRPAGFAPGYRHTNQIENSLFMQLFAQLVTDLHQTTRTNDRRDALLRYLQRAPDEDKIWVVALLTGRRPRRLVQTTLLRQWCQELSGLQTWLFDECYHTVGDLAETLSLVLPEPEASQPPPPLHRMMEQLQQLQQAPEADKKAFVCWQWRQLPRDACFVFNKIIIGGFRMGVSENLIIQALALYAGQEPQTVAHLISGNWTPRTTTFQHLMHNSDVLTESSKPYPFFLAYGLEGPASGLGEPHEWQVEWKWDGIRGQLICRSAEVFLWSRGEELVTERFPEIASLQPALPDGIALDGEILAFKDGRPLPFQFLQTRIGRKTLAKKQLQEAPVVFMAYDLLEWQGEDWRQRPLSERRRQLEQLLASVQQPALVLSPLVEMTGWSELDAAMGQARERACEGFMIKRKESVYQAGRRRGDWWKWKADPLSVDAVLIYAQKGHGKRSNLYTDYTFAVRDGERLVPFAKAYSGLTDKEIAQVDKFVRANSLEQFGPVRTVRPELVFEIAFEGISASGRHKSGVAVRFPRILRWRTDKQASEANTLEELKQLLQQYGV